MRTRPHGELSRSSPIPPPNQTLFERTLRSAGLVMGASEQVDARPWDVKSVDDVCVCAEWSQCIAVLTGRDDGPCGIAGAASLGVQIQRLVAAALFCRASSALRALVRDNTMSRFGASPPSDCRAPLLLQSCMILQARLDRPYCPACCVRQDKMAVSSRRRDERASGSVPCARHVGLQHPSFPG